MIPETLGHKNGKWLDVGEDSRSSFPVLLIFIARQKVELLADEGRVRGDLWRVLEMRNSGPEEWKSNWIMGLSQNCQVALRLSITLFITGLTLSYRRAKSVLTAWHSSWQEVSIQKMFWQATKISITQSIIKPLVADRVMACKDVQILIPRISDYVTLHGKRDIAHLIKFEIVRLS